jgi:hypothetical protein
VVQRDATIGAVEVIVIHGARQMRRMFPVMVAVYSAERSGLVSVVPLLQMLQEIMITKLRQVLGVILRDLLFHLISIIRAVT